MSPSISPRLSFSTYLRQTETIPRPLQFQSCSTNFNDFEFSFHSSETNLEFSSADELFVDGEILPVEIKKKIATSQEVHRSLNIPPPFPPPRAFVESAKGADKDSRNEISKVTKIASKRNEANCKNPINQEIKKKSTPSKQIQPVITPLHTFLEANGFEEDNSNGDRSHESCFTESKISYKKNSRSSNWSFGRRNGSGLCPCPLLCRSKTAGKGVALSKEIQNRKQKSEKMKPLLELAHLQISSLTSYRHQKPL